MTPCLPQQDADPARRARLLADAREDYVFTWAYRDIAGAVSLPLQEKDDLRWWAAATETIARLEANQVRGRVSSGVDELASAVKEGLVSLLPDRLVKRRSQSAEAPPPVSSFADYAKMYVSIPAPPIVSVWERDDVFAWQAVAGTNPYVLKRLTRPLDHFPMTEAIYAAAVSTGDTYARAMAEGRLYVADYAVLDGLPEGTVDGLKKVNFAPIALYSWQLTTRSLVPVAIQTGQRPSRLFTPADGTSWRMARTTVSSADGNHQGILSHFALCHQVMESVILASRRQLSERHPLLVLLAPHFHNTLLTNDIAMTSLIGPDGYMDRLQSPTLDASLALAARGLAEFRLGDSAPTLDFARRGVDDPETLGDYPARDDALLVWRTVREWVTGYVRLYYVTDADVVADVELAAWVTELGAVDGGRLQGLTRPTTVDEVAHLLSQIVFRCTAHHASINYSSFDLFSFAPNVQTAAFGPGPVGGAADTEAAWAAMIPPYAQAYQAFWLFYEITTQLNRIGQYPEGQFDDPRVAPLLAVHQAELAVIEDTITQRNQTRLLAYPYQLPSRISLSIHV